MIIGVMFVQHLASILALLDALTITLAYAVLENYKWIYYKETWSFTFFSLTKGIYNSYQTTYVSHSRFTVWTKRSWTPHVFPCLKKPTPTLKQKNKGEWASCWWVVCWLHCCSASMKSFVRQKIESGFQHCKLTKHMCADDGLCCHSSSRCWLRVSHQRKSRISAMLSKSGHWYLSGIRRASIFHMRDLVQKKTVEF